MKLKNKIRHSLTETFSLLWQFKWYIAIYPLVFVCLLLEYFYPPAPDDPIFGSEATRDTWCYISQEVYVASLKEDIILILCYFLLGTSNMRNHPLLAKFIFLFPLLYGLCFHLFEYLKSLF